MIIKPVEIKKRNTSFQLSFYTNGERRRLSAGKDESYARRLAVKFEQWLLEGKDPVQEMSKLKQSKSKESITIKDFFDIFIKRHGSLKRPKTRTSYQTSFNNVTRCKKLRNIKMGDISRSMVFDYMYLRLDEGVTTATVNREKMFLSCMFSCAVEWGYLEQNPIKELKSLPESGKRDVDLSFIQLEKLFDTLPPSVANIAEFACYTGFRLENILSIRIEEIRFHDHEPTAEVYREVKGGRNLLFRLGEHAVSVVKRAAGHRSEGYVFLNPRSGTRYKSIYTSFSKAVRKLGLKALNGSYLRFQDLRHVFANLLHQNGEGATLDQLRPMMGHKDRATTDRYVTVNRTTAGRVLSLIPDIRKSAQKEKLQQSKC